MFKMMVCRLMSVALQMNTLAASAARSCLPVSITVGSLLLLTSVAEADSTWNVTTGDWSVAGNWIGGEPPNGIVYITNGGTATITQPGEVSNFLYLASSGTASTGAVNMTGGGLSSTGSGWEWVGYSGTGSFTQSGGTHSIDSGLHLGTNSGSSGTYNLSNGLLLNSGSLGWEWVGESGTGLFLQSGGTHSVGYGLYIGTNSGSSGTYILSSGLLSNVGWEWVGESGTGTFTQTSGTHSVSNPGRTLLLAANSGSSGTYNLNGGLLIFPTILAGTGTATFNFNGGTLQSIGNNITSFNGGPNLTANVQDGGAFIDTYGSLVGIGANLLKSGTGGLTKLGLGILTLSGTNTYSGGTTVNQGTLQLGNVAALGTGGITIGSSGTVDLNSFGLTLPSVSGSTGAVITDNSTPASQPTPTILAVNIASGGSAYAGSVTKGLNGQDIALIKGGFGTLNLSGSSTYTGGTTINQGSLSVTGKLTGGSVLIAGGATLTGSGSVNSSIAGSIGSSITATGNLSLGDSTSYTGFNHAGSLIVGSNAVTLNTRGFANLGVLTTLSGGTLTAPNGVTIPLGGNLVGSGTVNGAVAAGIGSTIEATDNLVLGDSNSYDGFFSDGRLYAGSHTVTIHSKSQAALGSLTTLAGGTLSVANGLSLDFAHSIVGNGVVESTNLLAKATIINGSVYATDGKLTLTGFVKGVGTYSGSVSFAGTYSPGLSPASVNLEYLSLAPSSTLLMEVGGLSAGSQYDVLNLSEAGMLDGTLELDLINKFVPTLGQTFDIINGTTTGHFSSLLLAPLPNGLRWNTSNLYTTGVISVVPEPSTLGLLGVAVIGLLGWTLLRFRSTGLCIALLIAFAGSAQASTYRAIDLNPSGFGASEALGTSGSQQVGYVGTTPTTGARAVLWSGDPTGYVDLNPAGYIWSIAEATNGMQQVGRGESPEMSGSWHALLWSGSAATYIDLNPNGYERTSALDVRGTEQVGYGYVGTGSQSHALLWKGSAANYVDLSPAGFYGSQAMGTNGTQQVGYADTTPTGGAHAMLWSSSASAYIDLNPPGFDWSIANEIYGTQQVGRGETPEMGGVWHALLWNGTATSYVDLHPSGFVHSMALDTNGIQQVGYGFKWGEPVHAILWSGTAESAVDLNQFLPGGYTSAYANAIDAGGNIVGYANDSGGNPHAILWQPVPEPSTLALLIVGTIGLVGYGWSRRRAARRTVNPTAFDQVELQDDSPAILAMPSRWPGAARRAA